MILEPKLIYRTARGEVPEGEHVVPLGKARVVRPGADVTVIAYGAMVAVAEAAAEAAEASVEVLDLRSLKPLDEDALLESVGRTGRAVVVAEAPRVAGFAAEVAAVLAEKAILDLRGPIVRVTGYDVPYPYWTIEDAYLPSPERVLDAIIEGHGVLMAYEFRMPDLGEGVAEGEIVRWLVAVGEEVAEDDLLVEIQTDKATVEVPSPAAGVVSRILAEEGDVVPVGELLVVIGSDDAGIRYRTLGRDGAGAESCAGDAGRAPAGGGARRRPRRAGRQTAP